MLAKIPILRKQQGDAPIRVKARFQESSCDDQDHIALIHQRQHSRDDMGNVIAEYSDYALAYQLVGDAFKESLGEGQRYTDKRIRLIEDEGQMTPRALSEKESTSTSAISQWSKPLIE